MGYGVDKKSGVKSELKTLLPRLKGFATALTGNGQASHALLKATCKYIATKADKEQGHTPFPLWAFTQMHTLWSRREAQRENPREPQTADYRLFVGRSAENDSAASSFARFISQLPPQQRGTLLLVYGEGWSYDETAEVFGVPIATVMTRLARSHAALAQALDNQPVQTQDAESAAATPIKEPKVREVGSLRFARA
jgi:RNA polymerase sigma-70 factor (ECF subfamily)